MPDSFAGRPALALTASPTEEALRPAAASAPTPINRLQAQRTQVQILYSMIEGELIRQEPAGRETTALQPL